MWGICFLRSKNAWRAKFELLESWEAVRPSTLRAGAVLIKTAKYFIISKSPVGIDYPLKRFPIFIVPTAIKHRVVSFDLRFTRPAGYCMSVLCLLQERLDRKYDGNSRREKYFFGSVNKPYDFVHPESSLNMHTKYSNWNRFRSSGYNKKYVTHAKKKLITIIIVRWVGKILKQKQLNCQSLRLIFTFWLEI